MTAGAENLIQSGLLSLGVVLVVAGVALILGRWRRVPTITSPVLKGRMTDGEDLLVLDVRVPKDFDGGHIPGAHNIPLSDLKSRLPELVDWREKPIAVICRTNARSGKAARMLSGKGFAGVLLVDDGMVGWEAGGYGIERQAGENT